MAANKFASMLHRNTNKIIVILVYAILEWILIVLLLLNSLFGYLIAKFAKLVGLQPPCPWCSRVDHILEPGKSKNLHRDLVCETHAAEISNLGFCPNHLRLAERQSMCEDCLASRPNHDSNSTVMRHRIAFISWVSHKELENGENIDRCSCCKESLTSRLYPPYLLLKPCWGDGDYTSKGTLIVKAMDGEKEEVDKDPELEKNSAEEDHDDEGLADDEHQILSDIESFILREVAEDRSSSVSNLHSDEKDREKDEQEDDLAITELDPREDRSLELINMHFEKYVACDTQRLIPIDLIDSLTSSNFGSCNLEEGLGEEEEKIETFAFGPPIEAESSILQGVITMSKSAEKKSVGDFECFNISMTCLEDSIVLEVEELKEDSVVEVHPQSITTEGAQISSNDGKNVEAAMEEPDNAQANLSQSQEPVCSYEYTQEDETSTSDDDTEVQNAFDEFVTQNNLCKSQTLSNDGDIAEAALEDPDNAPQGKVPQSKEPACYCECIEEDQSSTSDDDTEVPNACDEFISQNNLCANDNEDADMLEKTYGEGETIHESSKCSEAYEAEEDKLPETPSSVDGYLHRKLMLFEKRELGAEESADGSVSSEAETGDPVLAIERLKTTLKTERKALSALYQELEEERSASAIAANQTMAMITRLQEEKAAMQMEALQYQRMMEEQSEYDQEALQLLNELMAKREKEKQELEKELEEFRVKVIDYEATEKLSVRRRDSDSSCSNVGDTEEIYIDLNQEARDEDNSSAASDTVSNLEEMALEYVKQMSSLDDSLAEFEEEKLSILDQLKALEEKLISLGENEKLLDDIQRIEDLNENCNFNSSEDNNGFSDGKHSPRRTMDSLAKRLLPYLDAADDNETEEVDVEKSVPSCRQEMESKQVSIEEEVDHVYEKLQALETDREFLNNCRGSMQNGDKGVDILQEIFQHLRDLKAVELRIKNLGR